MIAAIRLAVPHEGNRTRTSSVPRRAARRIVHEPSIEPAWKLQRLVTDTPPAERVPATARRPKGPASSFVGSRFWRVTRPRGERVRISGGRRGSWCRPVCVARTRRPPRALASTPNDIGGLAPGPAGRGAAGAEGGRGARAPAGTPPPV